jgi:hypothetical protein
MSTPDFTTPSGMLRTLWHVYKTEQPTDATLGDITFEFFRTKVWPSISRYHAGIIDKHDDKAARDATLLFGESLSAPLQNCPRGWGAAFEAAYHRGDIGLMAYGASLRMCYRRVAPNDGHRGEHLPALLRGLRSAPRESLMFDEEHERFAALPDVVTLYRGAITPTIAEAAAGLSWSTTRAYSNFHVTNRAVHTNRSAWAGKLGKLFVVEAQVPKEAIFLWACSPRLDTLPNEMLVDYERLKSEMLTPIDNQAERVQDAMNLGVRMLLARFTYQWMSGMGLA